MGKKVKFHIRMRKDNGILTQELVPVDPDSYKPCDGFQQFMNDYASDNVSSISVKYTSPDDTRDTIHNEIKRLSEEIHTCSRRAQANMAHLNTNTMLHGIYIAPSDDLIQQVFLVNFVEDNTIIIQYNKVMDKILDGGYHMVRGDDDDSIFVYVPPELPEYVGNTSDYIRVLKVIY